MEWERLGARRGHAVGRDAQARAAHADVRAAPEHRVGANFGHDDGAACGDDLPAVCTPAVMPAACERDVDEELTDTSSHSFIDESWITNTYMNRPNSLLSFLL